MKKSTLMFTFLCFATTIHPLYCAKKKKKKQTNTEFNEHKNENDQRTEGSTVTWTPHSYKHFARKNMTQKAMLKSNRALYNASLKKNIESMEMRAWHKGTKIPGKDNEKVIQWDQEIGTSSGSATSYMRVEQNGPFVHGRPCSPKTVRRASETEEIEQASIAQRVEN